MISVATFWIAVATAFACGLAVALWVHVKAVRVFEERTIRAQQTLSAVLYRQRLASGALKRLELQSRGERGT